MTKVIMVENWESPGTVEDCCYISKSGYIIKREFGPSPNGNELNGKWVLRNAKDYMIDFDSYRNDLAERNNIVLERHRE